MRYFLFMLITGFALESTAQQASDENLKERMIQYIKKKAASRKFFFISRCRPHYFFESPKVLLLFRRLAIGAGADQRANFSRNGRRARAVI